MNILVRSLLTWILFIPIAFLNGTMRELMYKPYVGSLTAHQISTLTASVAYILLSFFMLGNILKDLGNKQLFLIGLSWVGMTMLFEFGFGHYINKVPWERLLMDYNIFKGYVWGLFLIIMLLTPYLVKLLKTR